MEEHDYDAIIIGGGHNGLVCAAYLAKAGKKVCVLERRHVLGGAATTEELWPGYKISTAAYVLSLMPSDIIDSLKLKQNGLEILPRVPSSFTPLLDNRSLILGADMVRNQEEISRFSKTDAERYPAYEALLERIADAIEPAIQMAAPDIIPMGHFWRQMGVTKRMRDARKLFTLFKSAISLGHDVPDAIRFLTGAATPILDRWFETDALKATLATDAIIGAFMPPSSPGSAYVLLHHVMGDAGGARGVWGYVRGGMGGLASALKKTCLDLGVDIKRESPVGKIFVIGGEARAVELKDGTVINARQIASSVDANHTFLHFVDRKELPVLFAQEVEKIDYSSASAKINLVLSEPPRFTAFPTGGRIGECHMGTMHISPDVRYIEQAYHDALMGHPSDEPVLEMTLPTSIDKTLVPEGSGHHVMNIFVQYAPYELRDGTWDDKREWFGDLCTQEIEQYAPGFRNSIIHREVLAPPDIEARYGLTGGNIFQGAMLPHQLFSFRPVAGWADHTTPIKNLFLCGAASHPGGGVMGICGRNAAAEMLRF
ncbi:MAG: NAD(P)/FAD-dependent oxidoreductase [bacterium]|nr:NAD(P)/FAD-dependent oxidoreductase [bacterium]